MLQQFCSSARVECIAPRKTRMVLIPQKSDNEKKENLTQANLRRIPDFVLQLIDSWAPDNDTCAGVSTCTIEVKAGSVWEYCIVGDRGLPLNVELDADFVTAFHRSFKQLVEQAISVLGPRTSAVHCLLIIDSVFACYRLEAELLRQCSRTPSALKQVVKSSYEYCIQPPTPIFLDDYSGFNPHFLRTMELCVREYRTPTDTITLRPHSFFKAPVGVSLDPPPEVRRAPMTVCR